MVDSINRALSNTVLPPSAADTGSPLNNSRDVSRKLPGADIVPGTVTTTELKGGALLADNAVTSSKLAAGAVIAAKIGAGAVLSAAIGALQITTALINNLAVTTGKLADLAVTTGKLAAGAVTGIKMASTGVTSGSFVGVAAPGPCTLTGATVGQRVLAVFEIDTASGTVGEQAKFEATITVPDQIQQTSAVDLHLKKYAVILLPVAA